MNGKIAIDNGIKVVNEKIIHQVSKWLQEQASQVSFGELCVRLTIHGFGNIVRIEKTITNKEQTTEAKK
jgi:hypothetical protein